jgi:hypothetical protein
LFTDTTFSTLLTDDDISFTLTATNEPLLDDCMISATAAADGDCMHNMLGVQDVDDVLRDMTTIDVTYSVVGIEAQQDGTTGLQRIISHDHDYCESDYRILNEFMDMTSCLADGDAALPASESSFLDTFIDIQPYTVANGDDASGDEQSVCTSSAEGGADAHDRYRRRRQRNNIACQKSRQRRRMNRHELMAEHHRLTERNALLKVLPRSQSAFTHATFAGASGTLGVYAERVEVAAAIDGSALTPGAHGVLLDLLSSSLIRIYLYVCHHLSYPLPLCTFMGRLHHLCTICHISTTGSCT